MPILLKMPTYFNRNVFQRVEVQRVLRASNCPERLTDDVIENCELAGLIATVNDGDTIELLTKTND